MQTSTPRAVVSQTASHAILHHLQRTGIQCIFTVPGAPLMPFLREGKRMRCFSIITCRHETAACLMAVAYYRDKGVPATVALTSGPGAANAFNGIAHAYQEQAALVVISARPPTHSLGRGAVQDVDTARILTPITKQSEQLLHPEQVQFLVPALIRTATTGCPGPVNLTVSSDQWQMPVGGAQC